jgi:hypothetical protein
MTKMLVPMIFARRRAALVGIKTRIVMITTNALSTHAMQRLVNVVMIAFHVSTVTNVHWASATPRLEGVYSQRKHATTIRRARVTNAILLLEIVHLRQLSATMQMFAHETIAMNVAINVKIMIRNVVFGQTLSIHRFMVVSLSRFLVVARVMAIAKIAMRARLIAAIK